ncbi:MAG TPA: nuclear transport factor 2 family protein [Pseudolabrys sp.]|nr:nuclear transport factor 2 family protein [Pseudolabrys sp.]
MLQTISRSEVERFYDAYATQQFAVVASFLHDDVQWTVSGPVDVLSFCGTRRGKAEVISSIRRSVPALFREREFRSERMLVDGNAAAVLGHFAATKSDGRVVRYRLAQFIEFHDGKIVSFLSVIDSFDAVEQVTGRPIVLDTPPDEWPADSDIVVL